MLIDEVTIKVKGGKGGDGAMSLRHLPGKYKGGPDGGNGGNGGSVYVAAINDNSALQRFQSTKEIKAEDAVNGGRNNLYGKNGKDVTFFVPTGTEIIDTSSNQAFELLNTEEKILIAKGGKGGRGNNEFKSATNQTPRFAEKGLTGEERKIRLTLRIIADIGIIGLPNAGKSSLLSILTHAHPKIADYPFTTLEPNLGALDGKILADIPGLIEGASSGRGLGTSFLKHIEKTKILLHCISAETSDVWKDYQTIRNELALHNKDLAKKREIILITKTDLIDNSTLKNLFQSFKNKRKKVLSISILDDIQIKKLKKELLSLIQNS